MSERLNKFTSAYTKSYKRPLSSDSHVNPTRPGARTRTLLKAQEAAGISTTDEEDEYELRECSPASKDQDSDGNDLRKDEEEETQEKEYLH